MHEREPAVTKLFYHFKPQYHTRQGFELLKKSDGRVGVIFYSLGNFLHDGLSTNGDGMLARVLVGKDGVNRQTIEVFPLANEERWPRPADLAELDQAIGIWQPSNHYIYSVKLPRGLSRMRFHMYRISKPAFGLRLKPVEEKLLVQP